MLVWPVVAVGGFVLLAALVIALAASSTARYEFERNQVQGQRQQAAVPAGAGVSTGAGAEHGPAPAGVLSQPGGGAVQEQRAAVSVATHPAGKRVVDPAASPGWWLVDEWRDRSGAQVVAGPFADRTEADLTALSGGHEASVQAVYGVQRADGGVQRRQTPAERAWLTELGEQLDRLAEDWDAPLSDDDAIVTLVVEVAAALVEAGLALHDCAGEEPSGGVCLTPEPGAGGLLVSWHQHDRMSREQVRGAAVDAAVQQTMNAAIAEVLHQVGFEVEPFGSTGCCFVPVNG
jgi:hypothetical protein